MAHRSLETRKPRFTEDYLGRTGITTCFRNIGISECDTFSEHVRAVGFPCLLPNDEPLKKRKRFPCLADIKMRDDKMVQIVEPILDPSTSSW